jgi:transcriptional regulator with XRE-family HTH domain
MGKAKRFNPTDEDRELVSNMYAAGITQEQIAGVLGVSSKTIQRFFKEEKETAKPRMIAKVAGKLFRWAMSEDPRASTTSCMFILKTQAGWRETGGIETDESKEPPTKIRKVVQPEPKKPNDKG